MKKFLAISKPTASWLVAWMVVFSMGAVPVFALDTTPVITMEGIDKAAEEGYAVQHGTSGTSKVSSKPCSSVSYANVLADPVDKDWKPDPQSYKILTLTEEACGSMLTGSGRTIPRTRLHKGAAIAVPLSGKGDLRVVACGNPFAPEQPLVGKYFECPTISCPDQKITEIRIKPDVCPNLPGDQETIPVGMTMNMAGDCVDLVERPLSAMVTTKEPWFCARGGWRTGVCIGIGALLLGLGAAALNKDNSPKKCDTCDGKPYPAP